MAPAPRLLLVELAVEGRFHRGVFFPFVAGWARSRGIGTRWIRFGVPVTAGDGGASLDASDTGALRDATADHAPSHLVLSHTPGPDLLAALADVLEGVRVVRFASSPADGGPRDVGGVRVETVAPDLSDVDARLGFADPAVRRAGLFEVPTPDFAFEPGNALARRMPALPFVVCGNECTYGRAVDRSGLFHDLDLSGCVRKGGCTFCARAESSAPFGTDPVTLAERQLLAVDRTCPRAAGPLPVRMVGEPIMRSIDRIAERLARLHLGPLELLLDSRPDTLVESRDALERALGLLAGTGHRVEMSLMGVESFSGAELGRLNKGVSPATNVRAVQTLFELEAAHPDGFGFRRYGGLSLITFTPWTSPAELDLNLTLARLLGVADLCGKLLTGRLRLTEGLPLTLAARRDGLIADAYDDPLLDTAARSFYEPEIPWRFREPAMEAVSRICVRLSHDLPADVDPLLARVREVAEAAREQAGLDEVAFAARVARAAVRLGDRPALTPEVLLSAVAASLDLHDRKGPPRETWEARNRRLGPDGARWIGDLPLSVVLAHKPVAKHEPVPAGEVAAWLADPELPNVRSRQRRREPGGTEDTYEVFFGARAADVERALELGAVLEEAGSREAWIEAATEVGALLGYPRCCARAYAAESSAMRDHHTLLLVARRVAADGPVPWELNPVPDGFVEHVPCALGCDETLARAQRLAERRREAHADSFDRVRARLENPHVLLFGRQGRSVELVPEQEPGPRFRYRAGACRGGGEDVQALVEGDELVLDGELTLVLRTGRPWASLSGRAFLWWHRRAFQTDLWQAVVGSVDAAAAAVPGPRGSEPPPEEVPGSLRGLSDLLRRMAERGVSFGGFRIREVRPARDGSVRVHLASADEQMELALERRAPRRRYLLAAGPLGVSYPAACPLSTASRRRAARVFAHKLEHVLGRARRRGRGTLAGRGP